MNEADEDSMKTMRPGTRGGLGQIDQYELVRKLGGGGFGVVYLALDTASGLEVAIKTLHPMLKHSPEEMETLREKFALVSRLAHPHIATALVLHPVREIDIADETVRRDLRLSPGDSVMVMRYAPGATLSKWRRQFPDGIVPFDQTLEVARQIASALDYAHAERIVHRDIKPGNIMVETTATGEPAGPGLRVRILDFGLAAEIRSSMSRVSTEQGDTSGTRPYMAPEQWIGRKQDGRTDQYALACVLHEMLSGAPPFSGVFETGDPVIMMAAVKGETPQPVDGIPEAANAALLRALSKNPDDRFPNCSTFVAALGGSSAPSGSETDSRPVAASLRKSPVPGAGEGEPERESALFSRKIALGRELASLSKEDREDAEFAPPISRADDAYAAAEEALKYSRLAAAECCLDRAAEALEELAERRRRRCEDELRAEEEYERARLEQQEAARVRREAEEKEAAEQQSRRFRAYVWFYGILLFVVAVVLVAGLQSESQNQRSSASDASSVSSVMPVSVAAAPSANRKAGDVRIVRVGQNVVRMHWCPPSTFFMGSPLDEKGRDRDEERHSVSLTKGFWISETVVTKTLWAAVMGYGTYGETPCNVSWFNACGFLDRLNASVQGGNVRFKLPTEAQWEYACRAGCKGPWANLQSGRGGTADLLAWHSSNSGKRAQRVGTRQPNAWGLHDMQGGVWEWCEDRYSYNYAARGQDPVNAPTSPYDHQPRVIRGGSAWNPPRDCRSASRDSTSPNNYNQTVGFRFIMVDE